MTCVVGLVYNGEVYMGADSAGADTESDRIDIRRDRKICDVGP